MAESATEIGKITDQVGHMAHHMEATQNAAQHASDALGNILKTLIIVDVTLKAIERAASFSPMAKNFMTAFKTIGKTADQLQKMHEEELLYATERLHKGLITEEQYRKITEKIASQNPLLNEQINLTKELNKYGAARLGILTGTVSAAGRLFYLTQELNEALIKSTADSSARAALFSSVLETQRRTGVAFDKITEVQRELIQYGFQFRRNYNDVLETVVKLNVGLGMSVREATELGVVTEQQVKSSFAATADIVATIVDQTSLAADEVGRLATNLGRAMALIKPGGVQEFPQIVKLVAKYEDALKQFGGQVGQFEALIGRMTKPEGLLAAGVLGITNPEQLLKKSGVDKAIENFYTYASSQLYGTRGFDRVFRLNILAEQFGTTAEQINAMVQAIQAAKNSRAGQITLEQRFNEQMQQAGEGFKRIYNSMSSLLKTALYPLIRGMNWLANITANFLETIIKYKPAFYTAVTAVGGVILVTIVQLKGVASAFWKVVLAAKFASAQLEKYASEQTAMAAASGLKGAEKAVGEAATGGAVARLGTLLKTPVTWRGLSEAVKPLFSRIWNVLKIGLAAVSGPLLVLAGIAGAVALISYYVKWRAKKQEEQMQANLRLRSSGIGFEEKAASMIYAMERYGRHKLAEQTMNTVLTDIRKRRGFFGGLSENEAASEEARFMNMVKKIYPLAQYTQTAFSNLNMSPEERKKLDEGNIEFQKQIAVNTHRVVQDGKKARDDERQHAEDERKAAEQRFLRSGGTLGQRVDSDYRSVRYY